MKCGDERRKLAIPNLLDELVSVTGAEPVEYAECSRVAVAFCAS